MKLQTDWRAMFAAVAAVAALGGPDLFFSRFVEGLEVFVRLGQGGVSVVTVLYIYRWWKSVQK